MQPELWLTYAEGDYRNPELAFPPNGWVMPYHEGVEYVSSEVQAKFKGTEPFAEQAAQFQRSLDTLASTLQAARPDVTVIISDDQDEWLYEHNMPRFAVYWADSVPMRPRVPVPTTHPEVRKAIERGYGDIPLEVPVASEFGRHLIDYLCEHDFDPAHMTHLAQPYGGQVRRRYPTPNGTPDYVKTTPPHERLVSATSESLNWVALGGALQRTELAMELLAYVPVYRTPAATGGGWAFARWQ